MSRSIIEESLKNIQGRWFDTITYKDGRKELGQHGEFEWGFNQIQNPFMTLLAGFCLQEATFPAGINVMAVGHGDVAWDTTPPTLSHSAIALEDEFFRKEIVEGIDSIFINPSTNLPSVTPTNKIELTVILDYLEANGALREFALFGGDALPGTLDSGRMVNWIYHSRIDKDDSMAIERKVRILFNTL
jgi:hypothetical protein